MAGSEGPVIDTRVRFSVATVGGQESTSGEARAKLYQEELAVVPQFGEALLIPLRDMLGVGGADYGIEMLLTSGEVLGLSHLGYAYEDFLRVLRRLRGEVLLRDSLMHEGLRKSGVMGEVALADEAGRMRVSGRCELRVYDTGLVILPGSDAPVRIPLSEVERVDRREHLLVVATEWGETLQMSRLGRELDPFARALSDAMSDLGLQAQASLKELLPLADPGVIRRAARFLRDGKAARRVDIESVSPDLWAELERMVQTAGIRAEYDFLASLAQAGRMCVGVKRGLLGSLTGDYIWFLVPIYGVDADEPGNVVAMEAGSSGGSGGRATYLFRLTSPERYRGVDDLDALHREADAAIRRLNRCMLAVNFRREPIYLPDERLREPPYLKYRFALEAIPELGDLRRLFLGRVLHRSAEQWKDDVMDLLRFSVTQGEGERWRRGASLDGPDEVFADEGPAGGDEDASPDPVM